ncbi:TspO/MBR family protein [Patulibacter sp.]|uniref:TspO/MBR family protein n=1 Tax=Patulibacter sp. TaxID=1912859 RepID=UPI00271D6E85|nr:TspO/MBR family protein [Patulibacter sp.]MDO9407306.1 TspO/MBR family protein [Patulibacter sp.]
MRLRTLLGTGAATAATAAVGGAASSGAKDAWFRALDKPPFQPPPIAFPIVWTLLYVDIAAASATAIDGLHEDGDVRDRAFRAALAANLVLNASWTWTFFRGHHLPAATTVAGLLAVSSADLARRASAASRPAGLALAPYAAWCTFATVLSGAIWRRNR